MTIVENGKVTLYAVWTRDFSITYELGENGNNNINNPNTFNESTPDIKLLAPSRTGYVFLGWYFDSEYTKPIENSVIDVSEHLNNLTIYAKWTEASFVVTFNSNGGTNVESQIVLYNNHVTKPITPVKENGKFLGWYKDEQLTTPFNFDSDVVTSNLTLYAKWEDSTYIVVFDGNGATSGTMANQPFTYNKADALTENGFERIGYEFNGWSLDPNATNQSYSNGQTVNNLTNVDGGIVILYAVWQANTYTVEFNGNGGLGTMANQQFTYDVTQALQSNKFSKTG